ncbi:MAG: hypothetical protein AAFY65_00200 [Pseudomonadota bacterium]
MTDLSLDHVAGKLAQICDSSAQDLERVQRSLSGLVQAQACDVRDYGDLQRIDEVEQTLRDVSALLQSLVGTGSIADHVVPLEALAAIQQAKLRDQITRFGDAPAETFDERDEIWIARD